MGRKEHLGPLPAAASLPFLPFRWRLGLVQVLSGGMKACGSRTAPVTGPVGSPALLLGAAGRHGRLILLSLGQDCLAALYPGGEVWRKTDVAMLSYSLLLIVLWRRKSAGFLLPLLPSLPGHAG